MAHQPRWTMSQVTELFNKPLIDLLFEAQQIHRQHMGFIKNKQDPLALVMASFEHLGKFNEKHGFIAIPTEPVLFGQLGTKFVPIQVGVVEDAEMHILLKTCHQRLQQGRLAGADIGSQHQETFFAEDAVLKDGQPFLMGLAHEDGLRVGRQGKGFFRQPVIFGIHGVF